MMFGMLFLFILLQLHNVEKVNCPPWHQINWWKQNMLLLLPSVLIHINNIIITWTNFSLFFLSSVVFKALQFCCCFSLFCFFYLFIYIDFVSGEKPEKQLWNQKETDVRGNEKKKKSHISTYGLAASHSQALVQPRYSACSSDHALSR